MKRTSTLIALSTLFHLLIIDVTFFLISAKALEVTLVLGAYNLVWLWILFSVLNHIFSSKKKKAQ